MLVNQRCKGVPEQKVVVSGSLNHYNVVIRFSEPLLRGVSMNTNMKRFSISLTPDLEADLDALKKDKFYNSNKSDMIRFLITLGLEVCKREDNDPNRPKTNSRNDEFNPDV